MNNRKGNITENREVVVERIAVASQLRSRDGRRVVSERIYEDVVKPMLDELEAKDKRIAQLEDENEYIRNRFKEVDRMFGKNILVMQASIIEWRETGNAENALMWIYNTLFGPGELPSEDEKDAQAYFNREYAPIDKELMELHQWFWERHKRENRDRAAGTIIKGENNNG